MDQDRVINLLQGILDEIHKSRRSLERLEKIERSLANLDLSVSNIQSTVESIDIKTTE